MSEETSIEVQTMSFQEYIEDHKRPIDLIEIVKADTQVLSFGERHPDVLPKEFLQKSLQELKALGCTHLALEMVDSSRQELLDSYQDSPIKRSHLQNYLRANWYGNMGDYYFRLIEEARRVGLTVVGIDLPKDIQDRITSTEKLVRARDTHMANSIKSVLEKDSGARVITFSGAAHVEKGTGKSMVDVLSSQGVKVIAVSIVEPQKPYLLTGENKFMYKGAAGDKTLKSLLQPTDWVIVLWDPDRAIISSLEEKNKDNSIFEIKSVLRNK